MQREDRSTGAAASRRGFLGGLGKAALSAGAVALIVGCESMAARSGGGTAADAAILNTALGLEHEAIAAYDLGAGSGLLDPSTRDVALLFRSHHEAHRDALAATIAKLGGTPVGPQAMDAYAAKLRAGELRNQGDVLDLAWELERQAANAYLGAIPGFADPLLAQVAGRIVADETMHWTVLTAATRRPLPPQALTFGA